MSSIAPKESNAVALARVQALIAGTLKHFPAGSFTLGSTVFTTTTLVLLLQSLADSIASLNAAQASAKDALVAAQGTKAKVGPFVQAYMRLVLAAFSNTAQTLADFGLEPPKARAPRTSEQKVIAAAKARATRIARGTTSRKQKLTVKGNVTGVSVTPITTPATEPSTQPVSSAPSAPIAGAVSK
jgi:hypothetical protein